MPTGKGIYDEEHRDNSGDKPDRKKEVPEDTPDVQSAKHNTQEPPD
ncbi:hypothetical protein [Mycobacterium sp. NS-7484]|nr:hypothetical protein [Mycobacterium sp. NS-7484]